MQARGVPCDELEPISALLAAAGDSGGRRDVGEPKDAALGWPGGAVATIPIPPGPALTPPATGHPGAELWGAQGPGALALEPWGVPPSLVMPRQGAFCWQEGCAAGASN